MISDPTYMQSRVGTISSLSVSHLHLPIHRSSSYTTPPHHQLPAPRPVRAVPDWSLPGSVDRAGEQDDRRVAVTNREGGGLASRALDGLVQFWGEQFRSIRLNICTEPPLDCNSRLQLRLSGMAGGHTHVQFSTDSHRWLFGLDLLLPPYAEVSPCYHRTPLISLPRTVTRPSARQTSWKPGMWRLRPNTHQICWGCWGPGRDCWTLTNIITGRSRSVWYRSHPHLVC